MTATTLELQSLYTRLKTTRAVAEHLGMSTGTICGYLRRNGVVVRKRGGDWKQTPGGGKKIERNRVENQTSGDPVFRAAPVKRLLCVERRADRAGNVLLCVETADGVCGICERGETAVCLSAGIRGGSLDPRQAVGW